MGITLRQRAFGRLEILEQYEVVLLSEISSWAPLGSNRATARTPSNRNVIDQTSKSAVSTTASGLSVTSSCTGHRLYNGELQTEGFRWSPTTVGVCIFRAVSIPGRVNRAFDTSPWKRAPSNTSPWEGNLDSKFRSVVIQSPPPISI